MRMERANKGPNYRKIDDDDLRNTGSKLPGNRRIHTNEGE
jgi:hypothetical protein